MPAHDRMTRATDVQKARDVLAKWRKNARGAGPQYHFWVTNNIDTQVKPLIVGTAGNPDLLDAIDRTLRDALLPEAGPSLVNNAIRIATAIIAADERMQQ